MYFDEDHLLEIRLNTLYDHVKKFVIVEASLDHAGNSRTPLFDIKKFTKFQDKIHYILVEDLPKHNNFYKKNWGPAGAEKISKEMHCLKDMMIVILMI